MERRTMLSPLEWGRSARLRPHVSPDGPQGGPQDLIIISLTSQIEYSAFHFSYGSIER